MGDKGIDEGIAIEEVVTRLSAKYPEVPAARVAEIVHETHQRMSGAKVRDFVPVLVEREAKAAVKKERKALAAD